MNLGKLGLSFLFILGLATYAIPVCAISDEESRVLKLAEKIRTFDFTRVRASQYLNQLEQDIKPYLHKLDYCSLFSEKTIENLLSIARAEGSSFLSTILMHASTIDKANIVQKACSPHLRNMLPSSSLKIILKHANKKQMEALIKEALDESFHKPYESDLSSLIFTLWPDETTKKLIHSPVALSRFLAKKSCYISMPMDLELLSSLANLDKKTIENAAYSLLSRKEYQAIKKEVRNLSAFTIAYKAKPSFTESSLEYDFFKLLLAYKEFIEKHPSPSANHFIPYFMYFLKNDPLMVKKLLSHFTTIAPFLVLHEQLAIAQGLTPFIHTAQPYIVFAMDLYTQGWSIVNDKPVKDFLFFRFENLTKDLEHIKRKRTHKEELRKTIMANKGRSDNGPWNGKFEQRKYLIFMNAMLFGNIQENSGSCSADYYIRCQNINPPDLSHQKIFKKLGLESLYEKYKNEIYELEKMHEKLAKQKGVILQLCFTDNALQDRVFLAQPGGWPLKLKTIAGEETDDIKAITQILQADISILENKNSFEFCMIGTNLTPGLGVTVHPFYNAQIAEKIAYEWHRDQLFAKIKNDYLAMKESK